MEIAMRVIDKTRNALDLPEEMAMRAEPVKQESVQDEPKKFIGSGEDVCLA
jgi:hypothetical protein